MATVESTPARGIFHLPITGHRNGKYRIVVGHAIVLDDEFTHSTLACCFWCLDRYGYAVTAPKVREGRKPIPLHQFVYAHYHGSVPPGLEIDHIDRDKLNNLPTNLRPLTHSQNIANRGRQKNNTSGYVGVHFHKPSKKWIAGIMVMQKPIHLGYFLTREEAAIAVNRAYAEHFPHVPPPNLIVTH